jgi:hypothetical protein
MMTLTIYKTNGVWMFDDEEKGILQEPFVDGFTELIDFILKEFGLFQGSHRGIDIEFSATQDHPDMVKIEKIQDLGDDWASYRYKNMVGSLCPVTLEYLGKHPEYFFVRPIKKPFDLTFKVIP